MFNISELSNTLSNLDLAQGLAFGTLFVLIGPTFATLMIMGISFSTGYKACGSLAGLIAGGFLIAPMIMLGIAGHNISSAEANTVHSAASAIETHLKGTYGTVSVDLRGTAGGYESDECLVRVLANNPAKSRSCSSNNVMVTAKIDTGDDLYLYGVQLHNGNVSLRILSNTNAPDPGDLKNSSEEE